MDDGRRVVQRVDHVVDGAAVGLTLVSRSSAQIDELLVASHLRAGLAGADAKELNDEQVELKDELANVLVHPDAFVNLSR